MDNWMENRLLNNDLIRDVNNIAVEAGHSVMSIYEKDFNVQEKSDHSPLTEADLASHRCIVHALQKLTPSIPILSEESADIPWTERQSWEHYWLIDPLDGTKEFIKRNGEFTVNIALVSNGIPILGVVYAPVKEILYFGGIGANGESLGAWKQVDHNKEPISVSSQAHKPIRVVGSRSHQSDEMQSYLSKFDDYEFIPMGSSLKICLVAEGKADIYPRFGPTSEWDTAAAHAVLKAAGGSCVTYEKNDELMYNTKESLLNPYFIVQGPQL
ncbi:3'(2'),5'-bisphosphate nucleotidase CysQ [Kangiella spongicola]|nr:3'(2'),5'-bisphosphate nucleotidase CysQ [Kangiella spongicola]